MRSVDNESARQCRLASGVDVHAADHSAGSSPSCSGPPRPSADTRSHPPGGTSDVHYTDGRSDVSVNASLGPEPSTRTTTLGRVGGGSTDLKTRPDRGGGGGESLERRNLDDLLPAVSDTPFTCCFSRLTYKHRHSATPCIVAVSGRTVWETRRCERTSRFFYARDVVVGLLLVTAISCSPRGVDHGGGEVLTPENV